ncbi:ATP-binding protein [Microbacterium aurum]
MTGLRVAEDVYLPLDIITSSNGILAKKGAGKTSAAVVLLEEMHQVGVPVIVVDPKGDWYGVRTSADGRSPGLPIPILGGRHGDIPLDATAGELVADLLVDRQLSAILDVSEFTKAEQRRFLRAFGDRFYRRADRTPTHFILEECHEYLPQQVRGENAALVETWQRIVKQGRFKGLGVTMASQRSAAVNKDVLTQIDNLFVLRTTAPQDRDAIKAWIDIHADSKTILAELPTLQTGECWLWQPERGEPIKFRFRRRHTFDAGTTPQVGEHLSIPARTTLADVDLAALATALAPTRTTEDDVVAQLRDELTRLRRELAVAKNAPPREKVVERIVEIPASVDPKIVDGLRHVLAELAAVVHSLAEPQPAQTAPAAPEAVSHRHPEEPAQPSAVDPAASAGSTTKLRSGAHRMVVALAQMAPLRLTKSQWGTVSHLKTSGGTWSTYLSDIRRAGFVDENSAGYTLTDAGFDYLGARPAPLTPSELQDHYRGILRRGAATMLDALIDAYPDPLSREALGAAAEISTSGGTFSTYLSDLTRNGLARKTDGGVIATEILIHGPELEQLTPGR